MSDRFFITPGDLGDASHGEALASLLDEYASSQEGGGECLGDHARKNLAKEIAKRPHGHVLIAWSGSGPAGLIVAFEGFSTFQCRPLLNIHDVIVSRAYRGQGLSKLLLNAAEDLARSLGCCKLTLEVLEGNTIAKAAYRSVGYTGYELDPALGKAMFWEKKLT
jgi:ribosomal protein S18 acetylase RimI-like enzyme